MLKRQTEGSVICTSCGVLVGVNDPTCYNCGRRNPGLWGFGPALRRLGNDLGFVSIVTGGTIILYVLSLILSRDGLQMMLAPAGQILYLLGASGAMPVVGEGRWWTLLTAAWLHGGIMHIFFNVLWIRQLGPEIANLYGAGRMIIIYTLSSIAGFGLSTAMYFSPIQPPFFGGALLTVGASAPIFGLLGALVHYGQRTGSSHVGRAGLQYALIMGVMGFLFPGVDNSAHLGGFAGGYLASRFLDPLKSERIDHLAIAVGCLVVTFIAIIWSVITALPQLA
ncbi:MAG TPA: rhomboid family intramembrane serine protease [Vicinamibacterales bacterium]|nr:rhomboid family intramembrane serine protease [Vicinamibacterales bacterium]